MNNIIYDLLEKSKEAFILGIEIYNKPTIMYRVEGFSFFICNAWELLLKAKMIRDLGEESIYYKDNKNRTLSLENCIKKVFTNNKDPLRINLEKIIALRNISTHYIVKEYEQIYVPLFQSCIINYSNKLFDFFEQHIDEKISQSFLHLTLNIQDLADKQLLSKYPKNIAEKIIQAKNNVEMPHLENNSKYSITINHSFYITKKNTSSAYPVSISKEAEKSMYIVKQLQDPKDTHNLTFQKVISSVNDLIQREKIEFMVKGDIVEFNSYHLNALIKYYQLKGNKEYCYKHQVNKNPIFSYSQSIVDFIANEIKKNPNNLIDSILSQTKK